MIKIAIDVDGVLAFDTPFQWGLEIFKNFENKSAGVLFIYPDLS